MSILETPVQTTIVKYGKLANEKSSASDALLSGRINELAENFAVEENCPIEEAKECIREGLIPYLALKEMGLDPVPPAVVIHAIFSGAALGIKECGTCIPQMTKISELPESEMERRSNETLKNIENVFGEAASESWRKLLNRGLGCKYHSK